MTSAHSDPEREYVENPAAEGVGLAEMAARRPDLQSVIARHPNAYDALLDWLATYGTSDAQAAVAARRAPQSVVPEVPAVPAVVPAATDAAAAARRPAFGNRQRVVTIAAVVVGVLVVAAGGVGIAVAARQSADQAARDAASTAAPGPPDDCDGYLALSPADRESAYTGRTHRVYGDSGVSEVPVTVAYSTRCPAYAGESYLLDNIDSDTEEPSCGVFLALTPQQRATWIPTLLTEEYWQLPPQRTTVDELARGCDELKLPTGNMVRLSSYLSDLTHYTSWSTKTQLGYSWNAVLGVGEPLTAPVEVGGDTRLDGTMTPRYLPGTACGFDPDTDGIIPLALLLTSTTGHGESIDLGARWSLQIVQGAEPITQAYLETEYTDGPSCSHAANAVPGAEIGVQYQKPDNEAWSPESYWVVLKNWRSPRFPNGATPDLSAYELVSVRSGTDADDPVVDFTTARIRLDGTSE